MTVTNIKQFAIFPDMPRQTPMTDKNGMMANEWQLYFDQLTLALQTNFRAEGIAVPQQSAANIALLVANANSVPPYSPKASIVYDSTNDAFKGNIAGTWKTFTLT